MEDIVPFIFIRRYLDPGFLDLALAKDRSNAVITDNTLELGDEG